MKKIFKKSLYVLTSLAGLFSIWSCKDDLIYDNSGSDYDGLVNLTLDFNFEPLTQGLSTKSVPGDLKFDIDNLILFFYDKDTDEETGSPAMTYYFDGSKCNQRLEDRPEAHCEGKTVHGYVNVEIPAGDYRIYAVANIANLIEDSKEDDLYIISEKELREIKIKWPENVSDDGKSRNPSDYGIPDAMFGYFTVDGVNDHTEEKYRDVIHHETKFYGDFSHENDKSKKENDNRAALVTLNKYNMEAQAWLKRVVSKLTVGFDGSALKSGVEIYIKSVQIKDAVDVCLLGHDNSKGKQDVVEYYTVQFVNDEDGEDERLNLVYSQTEGAQGVCITKDNPAFPRNKDDMKTLNDPANDKKTWNKEWYEYVHGNTTTNTNPSYNNTPLTLYFMENLQGVDPDHPRKVVQEEDYKQKPSDYNKDGKLNGTYVEVKAYYCNKTYGKETQGDITYRFMLGRNITDDFNAERNYHYKLIMSFVGDANNVDWHIEYEGPKREEGFYFRIPYNQDYDIADQGFKDIDNLETWYMNENWKQSNVWYAYDENHNPIAEIVKELVYYDENDKDYSTHASIKDGNVNTRDYYQVVSVYPVKTEDGKYITDFKNGIIAQVLYNDKSNNEKKAYGKVSMLTRSEKNDNPNIGSNGDGYRGYYVITSLRWGDGDKKQLYDYVYVDKDEDTGEYMLSLGEKPRKNKYETGAYLVKDTDENYEYPVVKIGTSYWLREDLRTTTYSTPSTYNKIYDYTTVNSNDYDFGWLGDDEYDGWIAYHERYPMYKIINGKYYYNFFAIQGVDGSDFGGYKKDTEAEAYYDLFIMPSDYSVPSAWINQEGAGYFTDVTFGEGEYKKYGSYNLQISPSGWHIPSASLQMTVTQYTGLFMEARSDYNYLDEYIGNNWIRIIKDMESLDYQDGKINKYNSASLSLSMRSVNGSAINLNIDDVPTIIDEGMAFPFWIDLMISSPMMTYPSLTGGSFYPFLPFYHISDDYGGIRTKLSENHNGATEFYKACAKLYLPVRCVRHSDSYEAPSYDGSNGRYVKIISE